LERLPTDHHLLLVHIPFYQSVTKFSGENENAFAFNVAVGKKPTNASFYVDDASSVTDVLVALSGDQIITRLNSIDTGASDEYFS
jgi:hypothetical protein